MGPQKRGSSGYAIASFTSELLSRSTIDMRTKLGSWRRCAAATINNSVITVLQFLGVCGEIQKFFIAYSKIWCLLGIFEYLRPRDRKILLKARLSEFPTNIQH